MCPTNRNNPLDRHAQKQPGSPPLPTCPVPPQTLQTSDRSFFLFWPAASVESMLDRLALAVLDRLALASVAASGLAAAAATSACRRVLVA